MSVNGKVTVWYMTEEERLAYIEKHPIIRTEKPNKPINFSYGPGESEASKERKREALKKARAVRAEMMKPDYKWRGKKGAESRWGNGDSANL